MNAKLPYIKKGYSGGIDFHSSRSGYSFFSLMFFFTLIAAFFLTLFLRLFQLTVVKGDYYRRLSEDNRIHEVIIEAQRGKILDRKGNVLAQNTAADLQQEGARLFSKRTYEDPEVYAHIIGYRQAADENDIKNDDCLVKVKKNDIFVDKVGKKGVEKLFECALRGKDGKKLIEVNAHGTAVRPLYVVPPETGQTVQLSIDGELQKVAYEQIKNRRAAVVGLKPSTGEVLILASAPSFNPQDFEDSNQAQINTYFADKELNPLFNRATEGTYPIGSTFKLVMATGALEEKTITEDSVEEDTGYVSAGTLKFGNWEYLKSGKMDGMVNVVTALKRSNDVYFYKIGAKLGPENIKKWAEKFGYNQETKIGIEESHGTVPSPFWKEEVLKEKWYLGDTYNLSIGQGFMLATPLQVARTTQAFANDGVLCHPRRVK
jgi:penicillin-binding protein 2